MSRHLPQHPSLEFLRKQAKALLDDLLQHNPAAQLADAQHELARDYGFASWPKLKAHVESLPAPETASPLAGRWTPDFSRSKQNPASPFVVATIEFDVTRDTVTVSHVAVYADGKEEKGVNTLEADGEERERGNGYSVQAQWRGPRVLEFVGRKDGQVIGQGSYEVSANGKTLTITGEGQLILCDRAD